MKTLTEKRWLLLLVTLFAISAIACSKTESPATEDFENGNVDVRAMRSKIDSFPKESLSEMERSSLILMREEEKLARDVYLLLYSKWGSRPFSNISASEQTHMDAVLTLLNKYNIPDPVGTNGNGVFQNADLQKFYNQLAALGVKSNLDGFKAGATIEDLDIFDLKRLSRQIDNQDILYVYSNLERGSRNHMRAFVRNIDKLNGSYVPQYLTPEEFEAIISSDMERGNF